MVGSSLSPFDTFDLPVFLLLSLLEFLVVVFFDFLTLGAP
jgi:hypothetical protein